MAKGKDSLSKEICSFCGTDKEEVEILIAGISGHICDRCVRQAEEIVDTESYTESNEKLKLELKKPCEIKDHIDDYVISHRPLSHWDLTLLILQRKKLAC